MPSRPLGADSHTQQTLEQIFLSVMSAKIETGSYRNTWKKVYTPNCWSLRSLLRQGGTWIACWITDTIKQWVELPDFPWIPVKFGLVVARGSGGWERGEGGKMGEMFLFYSLNKIVFYKRGKERLYCCNSQTMNVIK